MKLILELDKVTLLTYFKRWETARVDDIRLLVKADCEALEKLRYRVDNNTAAKYSRIANTFATITVHYTEPRDVSIIKLRLANSKIPWEYTWT